MNKKLEELTKLRMDAFNAYLEAQDHMERLEAQNLETLLIVDTARRNASNAWQRSQEARNELLRFKDSMKLK